MFEDTSFNVDREEVFVRNRFYNPMDALSERFVPIKGEKAIVRTDTGDVLSIMSKDYLPIKDSEVLDKFLELFDQAHIEVIPIAHHITKSKDGVEGKTTFMEVELPAYNLFPNTAELQRMRIIIPNSYNGTTKLKMLMMLWRQVCSNGMMGWKSDFEFGFKHRTGALDRLGDALNLYLLNQLEQNVQVVNLLGNESGQVEPIMNYLHNNKILGGERWQEKLMGHWLRINNTTNLWELYNLFTYEITHNYGRNFGSKLSRFAQLNHDVKHVWGKVLGIENANFEDAILV